MASFLKYLYLEYDRNKVHYPIISARTHSSNILIADSSNFFIFNEKFHNLKNDKNRLILLVLWLIKHLTGKLDDVRKYIELLILVNIRY